MRVGIVLGYVPRADVSVSHVRKLTAAALQPRHEVLPLPPEYPLASDLRQHELLKEWVASRDVIVGPSDEHVLRARAEIDRPVPYLCLLLGDMSRGGRRLRIAHRDLRTYDALIGNCKADAVLMRTFFPTAMIRTIPLAFDESVFCPADEETRRAARRRLGMGDDTPLVLYAGRLTIEKNVHTLLRTFSVVVRAMPDARLIIAGEELNQPFPEFGTFSPDVTRALHRMMRHLGLDNRQVSFVGQRTPMELRALYSSADVLVNLTLNHDENFGLAQVEAMACGLPAVGATWGGLKDTIIDGVTGRQIPAIVTAAGVKVDWWSAATSIVELLTMDDARKRQMREQCRAVARAQYTRACYGDRLDRVFHDCLAAAAGPSEPLHASPFAEQVWAAFAKRGEDALPAFRRGSPTLDLYRQLITPFATASSAASAAAGDAWCLATPIVWRSDDTMTVNDPIFPLDTTVPAHLVTAVRAVMQQFAAQAVLLDADLVDAPSEALDWLSARGILLRTRASRLPAECARGPLGRPAFAISHVDHATDVVFVA
jgi:glycosyltransferase involved in cell wall biosynthesis